MAQNQQTPNKKPQVKNNQGKRGLTPVEPKGSKPWVYFVAFLAGLALVAAAYFGWRYWQDRQTQPEPEQEEEEELNGDELFFPDDSQEVIKLPKTG